jgi:hypothetical protein
MVIKRLTIIVIITALLFGAIISFAPKITKAAPPAGRIPTIYNMLFGISATTDYRKVHVNISWTENGVAKHSDYYTIIRDLSH